MPAPRLLLTGALLLGMVVIAAVVLQASTAPGPTDAVAGAPTSSSVSTPRVSEPGPTRQPTPSASPTPSHRATPSASASTAPKIGTSGGTTTGAPVVSGIFVATTGSDANPGTFALPLRTIQRAAAIAPAGSTVWIRGGSYAGFEVRRSRVTFAAYGGESAVINAGSREDAIEFTGVTGGGIRGLVVQGSGVQYGSALKINQSSGVTVTRSTVRDNRTFGIVIVRSSRVVISGNAIYGNADGIEERYAGSGTVIANNQIYANTKAVDSGRGAEGINFYKSTGSITVSGNRLWNNGTHFEVYGASNVTFSGNVTWNGEVMETGTDGPACSNLRFVRNVGYRGGGYAGELTNGLILRCASSSLFAHNTFDGFDKFALDIVDGTSGVPYGGSIAGLRVVNNVVVGGRAFSIDSALPSSVQIDYNLLYNAGSTAQYGNHLAYMDGVGQFDTLAEFASATGYERHGVYGDPRFVNRAARDYRLRSGSPAIDRGLVVLSGGYAGLRPDLGRYEY